MTSITTIIHCPCPYFTTRNPAGAFFTASSSPSQHHHRPPRRAAARCGALSRVTNKNPAFLFFYPLKNELSLSDLIYSRTHLLIVSFIFLVCPPSNCQLHHPRPAAVTNSNCLQQMSQQNSIEISACATEHCRASCKQIQARRSRSRQLCS